MATYAVGDLQGCLQPLECLLQEVDFDAGRDRLWAVGDLVNRGPRSLDTLRFIHGLGTSAQVVLGNHDLHLLAVAKGLYPPSRQDTLDDILQAPDCEELLSWLRQQPLIHLDKELGYLMVHAGLPHIWSTAQALDYAREVEQALRGADYRAFLGQMYGDQPDRWHDYLSGYPRLRLITNYLTRMRLCAADGTLELKYSGTAAGAPAGFLPWFNYPRPQAGELQLLFGHWAALEGHCEVAGIHALDTGCAWGRQLCLMCLETGKRFYCDCPASPPRA